MRLRKKRAKPSISCTIPTCRICAARTRLSTNLSSNRWDQAGCFVPIPLSQRVGFNRRDRFRPFITLLAREDRPRGLEYLGEEQYMSKPEQFLALLLGFALLNLLALAQTTGVAPKVSAIAQPS